MISRSAHLMKTLNFEGNHHTHSYYKHFGVVFVPVVWPQTHFYRSNVDRSSRLRFSVKKLFLKISQYSRETIFFSREYGDIYKNTYFEEHLWTADSVVIATLLVFSIQTCKFLPIHFANAATATQKIPFLYSFPHIYLKLHWSFWM